MPSRKREIVRLLACWQMYVSICSPGNWSPLEFQLNILVAEIVLTTFITSINYTTTLVKVIWSFNWLFNGKLYVKGTVGGVTCVCICSLPLACMVGFVLGRRVCQRICFWLNKVFFWISTSLHLISVKHNYEDSLGCNCKSNLWNELQKD